MRRERAIHRTLCAILTCVLGLAPAALMAADSGEDVKPQAEKKTAGQEASKAPPSDKAETSDKDEKKTAEKAKAADPSLKTLEDMFASPQAASVLLEEPKPTAEDTDPAREQAESKVHWRKVK